MPSLVRQRNSRREKWAERSPKRGLLAALAESDNALPALVLPLLDLDDGIAHGMDWAKALTAEIAPELKGGFEVPLVRSQTFGHLHHNRAALRAAPERFPALMG